jgi:hypothetical protein
MSDAVFKPFNIKNKTKMSCSEKKANQEKPISPDCCIAKEL